jgi:hypothetical protein
MRRWRGDQNGETERLRKEDAVAYFMVTTTKLPWQTEKDMKNIRVAGKPAEIQNSSKIHDNHYYYTSLLHIYSIGNNTANSMKTWILCMCFGISYTGIFCMHIHYDIFHKCLCLLFFKQCFLTFWLPSIMSYQCLMPSYSYTVSFQMP